MLPKKHRFKFRRQIRAVKQKGKLFSSPLFGLLVLKASSHQSSCFGFIVSTKIHKKAVKRNRIRRLLSEAAKLLLPQAKPGFHCLFLAKKTLLNASFQDVQKQVRKVFQKASLLKIS